MAIVNVTVYRINGEYFPEGCSRQLTCGMFKSIGQDVTLKLPSLVPITCDEDLPAPVQTEILELDNGEKWWIGWQGESLVVLCNLLSSGGSSSITLEEDGSFEVSGGALIMAIGVKPVGGGENISIGTTPAGTELVNNEAVADGVESIFTIGYKPPGTVTLYVTGVVVPTTITLYKI